MAHRRPPRLDSAITCWRESFQVSLWRSHMRLNYDFECRVCLADNVFTYNFAQIPDLNRDDAPHERFVHVYPPANMLRFR